MSSGAVDAAEPTRARKVLATVAVILTVLIVWKVIDYRMQPPPPNPPAAAVSPR